MYSVQCAAVKTNVGVIKEPVHEVLCSLSLKYQKNITSISNREQKLQPLQK